MGKLRLAGPPTFRRQFAASLAATMVFSIACTACVWTFSFWLLSREILFRPANYYERSSAQIVSFAQAHSDKVLSLDFRSTLEGVIPLEGIDYQVLDASANLIYGSIDEPMLAPEQLWSAINTQARVAGRIVEYRPIGDPSGNLRGILVLVYDLSLSGANPSRIGAARAFVAVNLAAPFLFFLLFTLIFARRVGRRLEPPIALLVEAANRIRHHDLDFSLKGVRGSRELNELAEAFEEMRSALQRALESALRAERDLRNMVAAIAHDLQTPLSVIRGHVDNLIAREDRRAERLDRYLQTIRRNVERASHLVREMSEVAEIDRPGFVLTSQLVDLVAYFEQKVEEWQSVAESKSITLSASIVVSSDHDGWLQVDIHRVDQMLTNVLENALRVTPVGGEVSLNVEIRRDSLRMEISDSGPGLSERDLVHAFDPFYRGDQARSRTMGRSGLGLYIVKKLARQHGGDVQIGNRPEGGGAYVVIDLSALRIGGAER